MTALAGLRVGARGRAWARVGSSPQGSPKAWFHLRGVCHMCFFIAHFRVISSFEVDGDRRPYLPPPVRRTVPAGFLSNVQCRGTALALEGDDRREKEPVASSGGLGAASALVRSWNWFRCTSPTAPSVPVPATQGLWHPIFQPQACVSVVMSPIDLG